MTPNVLLVYRNRNLGRPGTSALGLGVNAMHTVNVLRSSGIPCEAVGVWNEKEIAIPVGVTHCVIEAPWASIERTVELAVLNPRTRIFVRCHSNLAFLQVEPGTINLMREILLYGESIPNLRLAVNSLPLRDFFASCYHARPVYLPNLYQFDREDRRPRSFPTGTLRAGSLGAIRLQKNHITGAAASLLLARSLGLHLEFHLVIDSLGSGAAEVVRSIDNLFTGLQWAKLIKHPWASFPLFRRVAMELDLAFHLSATETFSLSTADCLAEGVPVVGTGVIPWLPPAWIVPNPDDAPHAAQVGEHILRDRQASERGIDALTTICHGNLARWRSELAP